MSIISLLNGTTTTASTSTSDTVAAAIKAARLVKDQPIISTVGGDSATPEQPVIITMAAKRAAATDDDAIKEKTALAAEVRKTIDADNTKAGQKDSADLTPLSARALSIVALDDSGQFSKSEKAAAKLEIRERDRQALISELSGSVNATSLAAYGRKLIAARATMSTEEVALRKANPDLL